MAHFFTSLVIRGKRDHIMREEMATTRCVSETQTRSPVHMVSARGDTAELFYCHWLREKRLLPARPIIGCRGEQRSAHSSHPCYSRVRIQKPREPRRVSRTHTHYRFRNKANRFFRVEPDKPNFTSLSKYYNTQCS